MAKRITLSLIGVIVGLALLVVGSSLGAYVRAQVEEREAGAIACGDSVLCSRTDQVIKVINTGTGHGILGKTTSSKTTKAAVIGNATNKARGVYGKSNEGVGVFGESTSSNGIKGVSNSSSSTKAAVYGVATDAARGVFGKSNKGHAVYGQSTSGYGVWGKQSNSGNYGYLGGTSGVYGYSAGDNGMYGNSGSGIGVRGHSTTGTGVYAASQSGDLIEGWDNDPYDRRFRVTNAGDVYCDGSFINTGADFADMSPAVSGLEPADVLVIGPDGKLARSSEACSTAVAGVYSTKPGFIGGHGMDEDTTGKVPLAIVGIVPVKASAENGPICSGDLLATSATPGHAMKAIDPANGTIIGKAMESLESGTGTIKMLVTLQ